MEGRNDSVSMGQHRAQVYWFLLKERTRYSPPTHDCLGILDWKWNVATSFSHFRKRPLHYYQVWGVRSRQGRVYITKYVESGCIFSSKLKARVPEGREAGVLRWGARRSSHLWDEMASVQVTGKTPHHPPPPSPRITLGINLPRPCYAKTERCSGVPLF